MALEKKLKRLQQLKKEVAAKYKEINKLQNEVIDEMLKVKKKEVDLSKTLHATLAWCIEKKIDYDKLIKEYPDIYLFGLKPTFSRKQALNSVSEEVLSSVLKSCIVQEKNYSIKFKRGVKKHE